MKKTLITLAMSAMIAGGSASAYAEAPVACPKGGVRDGQVDRRLLGLWAPQYYDIGGVKQALRGLMMITPRYFMANVVIDEPGAQPGANANSGPYVIKCAKLVLTQWMQLHYRPSNPADNLLTENVPEAISYEIQGDVLTFTFPSGNKYVSKRTSER